MNIVILFYEPFFSGQAAHVLSLVRGLDRSKYTLTVVCPSHDVRTVTRLGATGVNVVPLPMSRFDNRAASVALVRLLRSQRTDLIHVHSQEAAVWGRIAAKVAGVPAVVYTPHTIETRHRHWRWLYYWLERCLGLFTDTLISVSTGQRLRLEELEVMPAERMVTIYNGINAERFQVPTNGVLRQELGGADGALVAQIGRLHEQKGPHIFLQAAALILRQRPDVTFLLVGEGPLAGELQVLARQLGLRDRVRFLGWRDDVPQILATADVGVLSSLWEGLPYTLLEIMAAGKPTVSTDADGCGEAVLNGETGFIVPRRDPAALAQAILTLLEKPDLAKEMGEKGRKRVTEHFSLEAMITKTEAVYDALSR
jgi:glycosyltransferase involved in cell wall biosynthesis